MSVRKVSADSGFSFQVGAKGDNGSIGSMGAKADIRTHIYSITPPDTADAFWVGDNLGGGGFIQFGYQLQSGNYCLKGEFMGTQTNCLSQTEFLQNSDPRWFWEYWPNAAGQDFYFGIGPSFSAGAEGSWHTYEIEPNDRNGWSFVLDGQQVETLQVAPVQSADPVYMDAEKVTTSLSPGSLGPVEFRNLEYLLNDEWRAVTSLFMVSSCTAVYSLTSLCDAQVPYGVDVNGPNFVIAGSGMAQGQNNELLWPQEYSLDLTSAGQITVDGNISGTYHMQVSLPVGQHVINITEFVPVDQTSRLRFDHWSDGVESVNRTMYVGSDVRLEATYVQQYRLTINSVLPVSGDGWYDVGTAASFSTLPSPQPTNDSLGELRFDGWYEDGTLVTTSEGGSIVMSYPHTLEARWKSDYSILELEIGAIVAAAVTVSILMLRTRKQIHQ